MKALFKTFAVGLALGASALLCRGVQAQTITPGAPVAIASIHDVEPDMTNTFFSAKVEYKLLARRCREHRLRFKLIRTAGANAGEVVVDPSSATNDEGYLKIREISEHAAIGGGGGIPIDSTALVDMRSAVFDLKFTFPQNSNLSNEDSLTLCVYAELQPYRCYGCGIGGVVGGQYVINNEHFYVGHYEVTAKSDSMDRFFVPEDAEGCPYANEEGDLVACYKRPGPAANWEAWILDNRDCKPYRVVLMPDSRWWMAQNLSFFQQIDRSDFILTSDTTVRCSNGVALSSTNPACGLFGTLYGWQAAMTKLGGLDNNQFPGGSTPDVDWNKPAKVQGVCPDGWHLPTFYDFGQMLHYVDSFNNPSEYLKTTGMDTTWVGRGAGRLLKTTTVCASCPYNNYTPNSLNAAWRYVSATKGETPPWGIDKYGFSAIPAGYYSNRTAGGATMVTNAVRFWTASHKDAGNAYYVSVEYNKSTVRRAAMSKKGFASVRCLRAQ
jgi:uncharacterized protein (TIGR02145 family)